MIPVKTALLASALLMVLVAPRLARAQTNTALSTNAEISVTPTNLNFGVVGIGKSRDLTLLVENVGVGVLSGCVGGSAPFSVVSGGTYDLTNHQSQQVTVRYSPKATGEDAQVLTFTGGGGMSVGAQGRAAVPPPAPQNLRILAH